MTLLEDRNAYKPLEKNPVPALAAKLDKLLKRLQSQKKISQEDRQLATAKDTALPRFYGKPKIHKQDVPLRPIVALRGTPLYGLSKWLTQKLKHLTAGSPHAVNSSTEFLRKINDVTVEDDETMVSFDVVSLFTSIPRDLAMTTISSLLQEEDTTEGPTIDDYKQLLDIVFRTIFQFNGNIYEQVKGTPMGSPISGLIAEAVLQRLEQIAFADTTPKLWLRYVDDTFVIIKREEKENLYKTINEIFADIQFTEEKEQNGQLAFLDVLIKRRNDSKLETTVFRKSTNTDRILQANSNHPFAAKVASIKPLFDRVNTHCSTEEAKRAELKTLYRICRINGYSSNHIKAARRQPRVKNQNDDSTKWRALPYIAKVSEATARILAPFGIKVAHRPSQTIGNKLIRPKNALQETEKSNGVYRIDCDECDCYYVGETKKRLATRLKQHKGAAKRRCTASQIYEHMATTGHRFNYDDATILATEERKVSRLVLESWLSGPKAINRSIDLPPALQALRSETEKQKQTRSKNTNQAPQTPTEPYKPPITRLQARREANTTQTPNANTSTLASPKPATQSTRVTRAIALR